MPISNTSKLLKNRRIELGISLRELAKKIGISHNAIKKIEDGECPLPHRRIRQYSTALNILESTIVDNILNDTSMRILSNIRSNKK
jgi:transcriptional regulator with XRE-family HTH domain